MNFKVRSGLSSLTTAQLLDKTALIIRNVDGNANFPTPDPAIADLTAQAELTAEWLEKSAFGDKRAIARRRRETAALLELMRRMATYVNFTANGDEDVILSSGFDVRRKPEPSGPLAQPIEFMAKRSEKSGEVVLDWKAIDHAKAYQVEYTTTDPASPEATWQVATVTSKSKASVNNLTRGTDYWFKVKAISGTKSSAYSDVALIMAA
ncbi:fibronectin type III domain-containing protein [Cryomorphaceae bacterium 1068]|nr:fibronectin type III domain-containing protein [Cryomorphaceae bacterium 1068]